MSESLVPSDGEATTTDGVRDWIDQLRDADGYLHLNGGRVRLIDMDAGADLANLLETLAARLSPPREGAGTTQREERWAAYIVRNPSDLPDNACAECMSRYGGGGMVKPGFVCAYHDALRFQSATPSEEQTA